MFDAGIIWMKLHSSQLRKSLSHVSFITTRCCPCGDTTETVTFPCLLCHNKMLPLWRYNWDSHLPMSPLSQQDVALVEIQLRQLLSHVSFVTTRCCPCRNTTETVTFPCRLCRNTMLPLWRYNWDSHFPMSPLSQHHVALVEIHLNEITLISTEKVTFPCLLYHNTMLPLWRYNWDSHFPMSPLSQQDVALVEIQLRQSLAHVSFVTKRDIQLR